MTLEALVRELYECPNGGSEIRLLTDDGKEFKILGVKENEFDEVILVIEELNK